MEDIAIIGISCRFPGAASSIEGFWRMMEEGQSAWSEFPPDRLNIDGFYHPDGHRQGSVSTARSLKFSTGLTSIFSDPLQRRTLPAKQPCVF